MILSGRWFMFKKISFSIVPVNVEQSLFFKCPKKQGAPLRELLALQVFTTKPDESFRAFPFAFNPTTTLAGSRNRRSSASPDMTW